ncbi:hypothetical protein A3D80_03145 [Candidatus Roizmanbacteria bacterium RIFCSPHIGHO2_02_FULL_40_13b]|uniref:Uncharacterized protein n=1 Tax=Candidatus Roizmanbacteria bacterium RIFCSPHIGHO2_01_FULL_39_24 TaxID=1802032 RepID=A0A1F7GJJ0_9BACT|nr:MAG: hypothetical protein A2799_02185 [Candidatus Roizmanbacteria bacterium RIFCSPHIGHO2_01_FULL_39_24]OGK26964.1 MAG: hypothetical protein A3D80_03145 [Candidatus Roizmanbacteria bacterium RIFCSPHIGHO2_02_FULL_40_13b]OGK48880.1 MAG: hypothetical protein A3A56_01580 [Candidatus Roizmanbacteria bacterium RIFCSPLOWO2_01_FULL_40_32]OGK57002.1 MAG: hypothetical protein A3H83_02650 [Candidatus Roizmanbacteria bacterium RIFCSPLOWO2_02_FULL_39_8]
MIFLYTFAIIFAISIVSQKTTNNLFSVLYKITRSERISIFIAAFIFLPGTFIHEACHLISALLLFLPVKKFSIIPSVTSTPNGYSIKLGTVTYGKRDPISGILVGIAPVLGGIIFFAYLSTVFKYVQGNLLLTIFVAYLSFVVASTMLSSKQDIVDSVYIIPLLIILFVSALYFHVEFWNDRLVVEFMSRMNYYLISAFLVNLGGFGVTKIMSKFI